MTPRQVLWLISLPSINTSPSQDSHNMTSLTVNDLVADVSELQGVAPSIGDASPTAPRPPLVQVVPQNAAQLSALSLSLSVGKFSVTAFEYNCLSFSLKTSCTVFHFTCMISRERRQNHSKPRLHKRTLQKKPPTCLPSIILSLVLRSPLQVRLMVIRLRMKHIMRVKADFLQDRSH